MYRARRTFRRFRRRGPKQFRTVNHFETDITQTAGGTEQQTVILTGVDDAANRSSNIPEGSLLRKIIVAGMCETVNAGKYQFYLGHRPGGETLVDPIASYFSTTDPLTQAAIKARKYRLAGPKTILQASAAIAPIKVALAWKGALRIRDGDDIIVSTILPATNQVFDCRVIAEFTQ